MMIGSMVNHTLPYARWMWDLFVIEDTSYQQFIQYFFLMKRGASGIYKSNSPYKSSNQSNKPCVRIPMSHILMNHFGKNNFRICWNRFCMKQPIELWICFCLSSKHWPPLVIGTSCSRPIWGVLIGENCWKQRNASTHWDLPLIFQRGLCRKRPKKGTTLRLQVYIVPPLGA